jgi:hypothetical protein
MTEGLVTVEQAETLRKKREDARLRKQKQRTRQRTERARQKQEWMEKNDPLARWERNRVERANEYDVILQRREENLNDLAWLETYIALLKSEKEPNVEDVLNVAASALINIEEYGFEDHICCPTEWLQEFQWAYESSLRTRKNVEYYEFGVAGLRVPRDLWQDFVELAGGYIKRVMPNYTEDETARRIVAAMRQPIPIPQGSMRMCPQCKAFDTQTWMSDETWNEYEEKGIRYRCARCREAERKARAESTLGVIGKETIFDTFGRVKPGEQA